MSRLTGTKIIDYILYSEQNEEERDVVFRKQNSSRRS